MEFKFPHLVDYNMFFCGLLGHWRTLHKWKKSAKNLYLPLVAVQSSFYYCISFCIILLAHYV